MKPTAVLFGLCLWCVVLLVFRAFYWHSSAFFFLPYNLALAALPWIFSHWAVRLKKGRMQLVLSFLWLLFFPNAPYILTDLVHLAQQRNAPILYDVLLLLSFAGAGMAFGFLSLRQMQDLIVRRGHPRLAWVFAFGSLFLAAFGIYLGRVVRLNSWDLLARPSHLLVSVAGPVLNPFHHLYTWAVTLALGVLLSLAYGFLVSHQPRSLAELKTV